MGLADCIGTPIVVGSIIVYPVRYGSSMHMTVGRVAGWEMVESHYYGEHHVLLVDRLDKHDGTIKRVKVERIDRVVVTPLESLGQVVGGLR